MDSPEVRHAGRELLSLALMDARNHTLRLISHYEQALAIRDWAVPLRPEINPPLWELGHIGWFQERWIARNPQRDRGLRCDPTAPMFASRQAHADRWWDSSLVPHNSRWTLDLPGFEAIKSYLMETLDSSLDLLSKAPDEDDALYFYRLTLFHEDMHGEALTYTARSLSLPLDLPVPMPLVLREPLQVPATRWWMGLDDGGGFTFDNERPAYEVAVPEFEIDAQAITWSQYLEFVEDGGYDRPELWQPEGWAGLTTSLRNEKNKPLHRLGGQPAMHLSWWEADAWCRWAGRRLPSEVEWEVAAHTAGRLGFRWGDVWEWTSSPFRGYSGFVADPYRDYSEPWFGTHKVLRGASFATRSRMKSPKYRNYFLPERNDIFSGFRSCAV
jgi:gamma-glutamyl hercynylcysteine S-oxide synthase